MTKKSASFDPNAKSISDDHIYGLPFTEEKSRVVYLPVPWDVTTSYGSGTHAGPEVILQSSQQQDLFSREYGDFYQQGLFMRPVSKKIKQINQAGRKLAKTIIKATDEELKTSKKLKKNLKKVNEMCQVMNDWVFDQCHSLLKKNKIPVVVGGDHSTPFGAIQAYAEHFADLGILHFDAHSDTRKNYMGFEYSHASIMYNVIKKIPKIKKLVQVGIRDFCEQEKNFVDKNKKIKVFYDRDLKKSQHNGESWIQLSKKIVRELPSKIYISFDIDGLDPRFCPNTGTPVPGGLDFAEILTILEVLATSGKTIVGFDLVEVAPGIPKEWDANVGMRLLYQMTGATLRSQKKIGSKA